MDVNNGTQTSALKYLDTKKQITFKPKTQKDCTASYNITDFHFFYSLFESSFMNSFLMVKFIKLGKTINNKGRATIKPPITATARD